jgi:DNA-binding NtrC family response regulator
MRIKLEEDLQAVVNGEKQVAAAPDAERPATNMRDAAAIEQPRSLHAYRAEAEATAISRALELVGWNRRRAAELLRISYRGLLYKIRQYNITAAGTGQAKAEAGSQQLDET